MFAILVQAVLGLPQEAGSKGHLVHRRQLVSLLVEVVYCLLIVWGIESYCIVVEVVIPCFPGVKNIEPDHFLELGHDLFSHYG